MSKLFKPFVSLNDSNNKTVANNADGEQKDKVPYNSSLAKEMARYIAHKQGRTMPKLNPVNGDMDLDQEKEIIGNYAQGQGQRGSDKNIPYFHDSGTYGSRANFTWKHGVGYSYGDNMFSSLNKGTTPGDGRAYSDFQNFAKKDYQNLSQHTTLNHNQIKDYMRSFAQDRNQFEQDDINNVISDAQAAKDQKLFDKIDNPTGNYSKKTVDAIKKSPLYNHEDRTFGNLHQEVRFLGYAHNARYNKNLTAKLSDLSDVKHGLDSKLGKQLAVNPTQSHAKNLLNSLGVKPKESSAHHALGKSKSVSTSQHTVKQPERKQTRGMHRNGPTIE